MRPNAVQRKYFYLIDKKKCDFFLQKMLQNHLF